MTITISNLNAGDEKFNSLLAFLDGNDIVYSTKAALPQANVTCRAYRTWLQQVKVEQQHYKLFKGVDLNEADLFELWQEGKSPVDALNDLSTAC